MAPAHIAHGSSVTYDGAAVQAPGAAAAARLAERQDLGVGGRVAQPLAAVPAAAITSPLAHDHAAHRNVAALEATDRLIEREPHEPLVVGP